LQKVMGADPARSDNVQAGLDSPEKVLVPWLGLYNERVLPIHFEVCLDESKETGMMFD
jgi:hypothetical protein